MIIGVVVLLLGGLVALGTYIIHHPSNAKDSAGDQKPPQYVLVQGPDGQVRHYGSTTVYDACNLLPRNKISEAGMRVNPDNMVSEIVLDRDVSAQDAVQRGGSTEMSRCIYRMEEKGAAQLVLYQLPLISNRDLQEHAHDPIGPIKELTRVDQYDSHGFTVTVLQNNKPVTPGVEEYESAITNSKDIFARFYVELPPQSNPRDKLRTLTETVTSLLAQPSQGNIKTEYPEPYAGLSDPCQVLTVDDYNTLYGRTGANFIERDVAVSEHQIIDVDRDTVHYYVTGDCRRSNVPAIGGPDEPWHHVGAVVDMYRDAATAKAETDIFLDPNHRITQMYGIGVPLGHVGDGDAFYTKAKGGDNGAIVFRVGRLQVTVDADELNASTARGQAGARLIAMSQNIARRING